MPLQPTWDHNLGAYENKCKHSEDHAFVLSNSILDSRDLIHTLHPLAPMLSSASVARGLRASSSRLPTKRYASHGAPQYNEPSGWLFGEKVRNFSSHIVRGSYDLTAKH